MIWKIKGVELGKHVKFYGKAQLCRFPGSTICVGSNTVFRSDKISNLIGVNRQCIISTNAFNSKIVIGANCGFSGVTIGCLQNITIGDNVPAGANVLITDFDWHNIDPSKRRSQCTSGKPVQIEDNVFIGVNAVILKGVSIGHNSVIGANSVVTTHIPSNCIAAGNPAKVVKRIHESSREKKTELRKLINYFCLLS